MSWSTRPAAFPRDDERGCEGVPSHCAVMTDLSLVASRRAAYRLFDHKSAGVLEVRSGAHRRRQGGSRAQDELLGGRSTAVVEVDVAGRDRGHRGCLQHRRRWAGRSEPNILAQRGPWHPRGSARVPAESENMLAPVAVTVVDAVEVMVKGPRTDTGAPLNSVGVIPRLGGGGETIGPWAMTASTIAATVPWIASEVFST